MPHIVMLTLDHSPQDDRIFYKEARSLLKAGFEVSIVCRADERGRVFDMGGREVLNPDGNLTWDQDGIQVCAIPAKLTGLQRFYYKAFRGSFFRDFIQKAVELQGDAYHAHEPVSFWLGLQAAKQYKNKVIFDSHESWIGGSRKDRYVRSRYVSELQYLISANHLTRGNLLAQQHHAHSQVIYNAAEKRLFDVLDRTPDPDHFTIVHDGYLPFNRGLRTMVDMMRLLAPRFPQVRLKLVGETRGSEREFLQQAMNSRELQGRIIETGWLPYEEVPKALAGCSVGIIAKTRTINNIIGGPPIKYFNYTAAGLPVIDVNMPETTRLLDEWENGISVREPSAQALADAVTHLLEHPDHWKHYAERSLRAFETLHWEAEAEKLVRFYHHEVFPSGNLTIR
ncbi:MAG: glycosyltransferase family 4 protein [Leptolyngbya sp. SIO3F4]|nr:glycosyltransferase family 4 protein [Leptolyngbya sp. SIO3F4]